MPWREVVRKVFDCDGCGTELVDPEFKQTVTFPLDAELGDYDIREDNGWAEIDGKVYCPKDWHWCEGLGWQPRLGTMEACTDAECLAAR